MGEGGGRLVEPNIKFIINYKQAQKDINYHYGQSLFKRGLLEVAIHAGWQIAGILDVAAQVPSSAKYTDSWEGHN
jgi:hypothetical protein